jgi:hypothetical protein
LILAFITMTFENMILLTITEKKYQQLGTFQAQENYLPDLYSV